MLDDIQEVARSLVTSPQAHAIVALLIAAITGHVATRVLRRSILRVAHRTPTKWDDLFADRFAGPSSAFITLQLFRVALRWVALSADVTGFLHSVIELLTIVVVLWAAFRAIDLVRGVLEQRQWAVERPSSRSLLALGARFGKVAVLVLGTLVALSQLGISVASLIAGLGIGGLVFALAAQKTVENMFGTVSIGVDQPMREGDFVRVGDLVGTVERIGLRSTRIRTLDRTLVTLPNGELSNQRIESFTARDRIRLACTVGVEYRTTVAQMREVLAGLERTLREHPKIWPDAVVVKFKELGASSLDIEIMAWFQTSDFGEFQGIRQEILLGFMEVVERAGTSCAFPTRTVHLVGAAPPPVPPSAPPPSARPS